MATTILDHPKPLRVYFSFAAYAKNLIQHLRCSNIPVEPGLTESEFSDLESSFQFTFPPDLRSILQEGLPIGPGFPNWRLSSKQQLHILINLPILGICKEVVSGNNHFWVESWGDRPDNIDHAAKVAKACLRNAPILVPIYGHFYIPTTPVLAGNPVFYVRGGDVKLWSFDIAGFFQKVEFCNSPEMLCNLLAAPAWGATVPRRVEFWTEMVARVEMGGWWSGELGGCLEEVFWRLRDGGWKMEDVREMIDGCDDDDQVNDSYGEPLDDRMMSERLLSVGWSTEDVMESLGSSDYCFDFHHAKSCDDDHKTTSNNSFFTIQFIRV